MNTLGNKIKVFRKIKGISQFNLELTAGLSTGTLSRIENNETNPTKETLLKLAKILKLGNMELDYLIGFIAEPASIEEIEVARKELKEFIKKPGVLAYVFDERSRIIDISDTFCKVAKLEKDKLFLLPSIIPTFDKQYGVRQFFDDDSFHQTAFDACLRNYQEVYFMEGDIVYNQIIKFIDKNQEANQIWSDVKSHYEKYKIRNEDTRFVYFNIYGHKFKLSYSVEPLWSNQRFRIFEYKPNNKILQIFMQFI